MPLVTRLMHTVTSFLLVVVAYVLYALGVVPFVEPGVVRSPNSALLLAQQVPFDPPARSYRQRYASLFPPGSWELEDAKVLKTDSAILLLRDYQPLENGELKIDGCTIIYNLEADRDGGPKVIPGGSQSRPIVMRAREAILKFSGDLDVRRGHVGRILGGRLPGPISVTREESQPGAGDSLQITTESVQIRTDRIWTPHDVKIRYGSSTITGRDLTVLLHASKESNGGDSFVSSLASGVKSVELAEVDRVHIKQKANKDRHSTNEVSADPATTDRATDLELTCDGPFRLDFVSQLATMNDHVDVIQLCPDGASDQLSCQRLSAHFSLRPSPPNDKSEPTSTDPRYQKRDTSSDWQIERIVAQGDPVLFQSPDRYGNIRCDVLEYDLIAKRFRAEAHDKVSLKRGPHEIEAPSLRYEMNDGRRIGSLWATGPGRFLGSLSDDRSQSVEAFWSKELVLRPDRDEHLLSLVGQVSTAPAPPSQATGCWVQSAEFGRIDAGEIHVWLEEESGEPTDVSAQPAEPSRTLVSSPGVRARRMLAEGLVVFDSSRIRGKTNSLGIWIEPSELTRPAGVPVSGSPQPSSPGPLLESAWPQADTASDRAGAPAVGVLAAGARPPASLPPYVQGDWIRVLLAQQPRDTIVKDVSVLGHAQLNMAGRMQLAGGGIEMDRQAGRAWIDGPGDATLPMKRNLSGTPLGRPDLVTIQWKQGMDFDGRAVQCRGAVVARTRSQTLWTDLLKITLDTEIDFQNFEQHSQDVQARFVEGVGNVHLESQSTGQSGLESINRLFVHEFLIDLVSGQCQARGPGWIKHVGTGAATTGLAGGQPKNESKNELEFLGVVFQDGIEGNLNDRVVQLNRDVRAVYGPVKLWNDELEIDPNLPLEDRTILMNCDRLTVAQIGSGPLDKTPIDLRAIGNTVVEHRDCVAYAHQVKYDQQKDLLVLEGDGRSKAELIERGKRDSSMVARKIWYSRSHRIFRIEDGDSLQSVTRGQSPPR